VSAALDVASAVLLLAGSLLTVVAAVGLFRLPDAYGRLHVATKPATLGIALTLSGALLQVDGWSPATKLVLALCLQFATVPAASHLLGRAARDAGLTPARPDALDELDGPDGPGPADDR
jgi:multicomponent Na+:H+ antiporter subunit G